MRHAQRMALVVMLVFAGLPAGVAQADWQTDRAQMVAATVWDNPCNGQVTLWFTAPLQPNWRAWAYPQLCTIGVSTSKPWRWEELCPVLMHEYGHLAGYTDPLNPQDVSHSHDPDDLMWRIEHYDRRCDDYGSAVLGIPRPAEAPPAGGLAKAVSVKRKGPRGRRATAARNARGSAGRSRGTGSRARRSRAR